MLVEASRRSCGLAPRSSVVKPAKVQYRCDECGHEGETRGQCIRHMPLPKEQRPKRGITSRKFTAADDVWKKVVKDRDGWTCRRCGKDKSQAQIHAAHIMRSTYKALRKGFDKHTGDGCCLRHDLRNGIAMCAGCHIMWAHQNPHAFVDWIIEEIGRELYGELSGYAHRRKTG